VTEEEIREGVRRVGKVIREQIELFSTLTGAEPEPAPAVEEPSNVVRMQQRRRAGGGAA
jgi:2-aminoadipate transaminase